MIKALLFDFDGLIMDTETPQVRAWEMIFAEQGVKFPLDIWVNDVVGSTSANFNPADYLSSATGRIFNLEALLEQARSNELEARSKQGVLPGVLEIIADARRLNMHLAIASSSPHRWVDGYLSQLNLTTTFDAIVCREDAQAVKPAPDIFLTALSAVGVKAAEALIFEDSPNGILAANRAGVRVVAVPNMITKHASLAGADMVLGSLAELTLEEIIDKLEH